MGFSIIMLVMLMFSQTMLMAQDYKVVARIGLDCNAAGDVMDDYSFYVSNRSTDPSYIIKNFYFDVSTAAMPDLIFDPWGLGGDLAKKQFTAHTLDSLLTGMKNESYQNNVVNGYESVGATFNYTDGTKQFFHPGDELKFSIDVDPTSLKDLLDPGNFGLISGGEMAGTTLTVEFGDGTVLSGRLYPDVNCPGQSTVVLSSTCTAPAAPSITLDGITTLPARTFTNPQNVIISGNPGDSVILYVSEAEMALHGTHYDNDFCKCWRPWEVDEYEGNNFLNQQAIKVEIPASGSVTVPVDMTNNSSDIFDGLNHFYAVTQGAATGDSLDGKPLTCKSALSNVEVMEFIDGYPTNLNINVGDTVNSHTDIDGETFLTDRYYYDNINSHPFHNGNVASIAGTTDDPLYLYGRAGYIQYDIPLENGEYDVTFYFAELHYGTPWSSHTNHPGARDFDIFMENDLQFARYDIIAAAGSTATATTITFRVSIKDRELYLKMADDAVNPTGGPLLNGISIRPVIPTSLPVEILSFEAKAEENSVLLNWATASEKNNDYFTVEKSSDGILFQPVTQVDGAGTTSSIQKYSAVDGKPFTGLSYYRLKQTDMDGGSMYSATVAVLFTEEPAILLYPNPVSNGEATLQTSGFDQNRKLTLKIKDLYYRDVLVRPLESNGLNGGTHRLQFSDLPAGVYMLSLSDGISTQVSKIIIR